MFGTQNFVNCINEQMTARGFGEKRRDEIIDRFMGLREMYHSQGQVVDADMLAMQRVFAEVIEATQTRARLASHNLAKAADIRDRIYGAERRTFFGGSMKADPGRAAVSLIEHDPRFGGLSVSTEKESARGRLFAVMSDVLEKFGKGFMGVQRGKAHLSNVVREAFGENTGDVAAKELSTAWRKTHELSVDMVNQAGGALKKLADWHMPQMQTVAKLVRAGFDEWAQVHMNALDWGKMAWPNGAPIEPAKRMDVLQEVYNTLKTGGANKIKPGSFSGMGSAVGNMVDEHRFLIYKDAQSWLDVHERYGDGSVFDLMVQHIDDMAHQIALIQVFGSNPSHMADTAKAWAMKRAADLDNASNAPSKDRTNVSTTTATLKNKFDPMYDLVVHGNPLDPDNKAAAAVVGTGNVLTSAMLGAASLLAIPGDFVTRAAVKMFNAQGISPFDGVSFYLRSVATDRKFMREIAAQSGFIMDEAVAMNYAMQRFTGIATVGPAITRRLADMTMRASFMSGHTSAARWTAQAEFMGMMARHASTAFDDLPFKDIAQRYGIGAQEWDAFRQNVQPWSPANHPEIKFLRPIDVLNATITQRSLFGDANNDLYRMFQGMITDQARMMVPESTIEAAAMLKGTTRPDTLIGAVGYSFAMFKNLPATMMMTYGRLATTSPHIVGRLGFVAGLGAALTVAGAFSTQMKEIVKGRDPLPMNTAAFWGKALLSGGALSIWGDFIFQGLGEHNRGIVQTLAGPLGQFVEDTSELALGDTAKFLGSSGTLKKDDPYAGTLAKAVEYARRYTPGTSIWWARSALERQVFDRLQELADPRAYQAQRRKMDRQRREYGNEYFWQPGARVPDRAPSLDGVIGQ